MTETPSGGKHAASGKPPNERYRFRELTFEDIPELHRLDALCFPQGRAFTEGYFMLLFLYHRAFGWALEITDRDQHPRRKAVVIGQGATVAAERIDHRDSIVAFILLTIRRCAANVATIDVHPLNRRQGLGRWLLVKAEEDLRVRNINRITLQVAVSNGAAIRLYSNLGYRKVKTMRGYYGGEEDGILMEKEL